MSDNKLLYICKVIIYKVFITIMNNNKWEIFIYATCNALSQFALVPVAFLIRGCTIPLFFVILLECEYLYFKILK